MHNYNRSLWERFIYDARVCNARFIVRVWIKKRILGIYMAITYPWWLLKWWYSLLVAFIKWLPKFIKSIPSMPRRFYLWIIQTFLNAKKRVFKDHVYLRRRTYKKIILINLNVTLFWYLFLSFMDEFKYHTNNHFAEINKWWISIFDFGFERYFIAFLVYTILWLLNLYFIGWRYQLKTWGYYYFCIMVGILDYKAPDVTHEWLFMFVQTYHIPTYIFCSWYCWAMNDNIESAPGNNRVKLPKFKVYSWEYDHFVYRIQEHESNLKIREKLQTALRYIKLRDSSKIVRGTF